MNLCFGDKTIDISILVVLYHRVASGSRIKQSQIKFFSDSYIKSDKTWLYKSNIPDLLLNTVAFAKFNYLTWQNMALFYTNYFTPSLIQIHSDFFIGL